MAAIKLGGEERALRFTMWSARRFKETYKMPLVETFFRAPGQTARRLADSVTLTYVVWAGLIPDNPKLTPENVEGWLDKWLSEGNGITDLYELIGEAMKESGLFGDLFDKDEEPEKKPEPKKKPVEDRQWVEEEAKDGGGNAPSGQ